MSSAGNELCSILSVQQGVASVEASQDSIINPFAIYEYCEVLRLLQSDSIVTTPASN